MSRGGDFTGVIPTWAENRFYKMFSDAFFKRRLSAAVDFSFHISTNLRGYNTNEYYDDVLFIIINLE